MINSEFIKSLNSAQKEAVKHIDGPLLIIAGAGSGKTRVITSRIANLIKERKPSITSPIAREKLFLIKY